MLNLRAFLSLDGSGYELGIKRAQSVTAAFTKGIKGGFGFGGFGAAAVGAGVALFAKSVVTLGGEIADMAARTETSTDAIQKWGYAAKQNGSDIQTVVGFFEKLNDAREKALEGDEDLIKSFARIGVSMEDLKTKRVDEIGLQIGNAVRSGDAQALIGSLRDVGGRGAGALVAAFKSGLEDMFSEAERLGLIITPETIAALDRAGDGFDRLVLRAKIALAPIIALLTETAARIMDLFAIVKLGNVFIFDMLGGASLSDARAKAQKEYDSIIEGFESRQRAPRPSGGIFNVENTRAAEAAKKEAERQIKLEERLAEVTRKNNLANLSAEERVTELIKERLQFLKEADAFGDVNAAIKAEELRGQIDSIQRDKGGQTALQINSLQQIGARVSFNPRQTELMTNTKAVEKLTESVEKTRSILAGMAPGDKPWEGRMAGEGWDKFARNYV